MKLVSSSEKVRKINKRSRKVNSKNQNKNPTAKVKASVGE